MFEDFPRARIYVHGLLAQLWPLSSEGGLFVFGGETIHILNSNNNPLGERSLSCIKNDPGTGAGYFKVREVLDE